MTLERSASHRVRIVAVVALSFVILCPTTGLSQHPRAVIVDTDLSSVHLSESELQVLRLFSQEPAVIDLTSMSIEQLPTPETTLFQVDLPATEALRLEVQRVQSRGPADFSWVGRDPATGAQGLLVVEGSRLVGTIWLSETVLSIWPLGNGLYVLVEWDPTLVPLDVYEDSPAPSPSTVAAAGIPAGTFIPSACREITLVVGFTQAALDWVGGDFGLMKLAIGQAVDSANLVMHPNSKVDLVLKLKRTFLLSGYTECCLGTDESCDPGIINDCNDLKAGNGLLNEIHVQRDLYAADLAVLFTANRCSSRGVGIPVNGFDPANESSAYAIVNIKYATSILHLAHEIAHIHGARHNVERDSAALPFPYGHGYCYRGDGSGSGTWNTVMSYSKDADGNVICSGQIPYWSNPDIVYEVGSSADPTGNTDEANVARVLRETACTVAGFRKEGSLAILPNLLTVDEGRSRQITVVVTRDDEPVAETPVQFTMRETTVAEVTEERQWTNADGIATTTVRGLNAGATTMIVRAVGVKASVGVEVEMPWWKIFIAVFLGLVVLVLVAVLMRRSLGDVREDG